MNINFSNIFILILVALATGCVQQKDTKDKTIISYNNIEKHIAELASDKYMGRAPMTPAEPLVLDYISGQMKEIGLEGANNGSYFQDIPILGITSKLSPTLDFETPSGKISLNKLTDFVAFSQKVEKEMSLDKSDVVFAGFGISAPEYERDDFAGVDVKGKTIIVFVNDPGYGTSENYFKGNTMTYYGRWTYKFEEAARQGAKACFIVHETGPAGYPWEVVRNNGETTKLFLAPKDGYKDRCSFEGWITKESAEKLFQACGYSFDELKRKAIDKNFKPFELPLKATATIKSSFEHGVSKNVCGLIKGKTRPDEVVVYTAHWDHLGVGTPVNGDSIYNGATDNASAVAWMLEIARAFKQGQQPERSVLFLSVTSEESGLLGSGYYAENPFFPMSKTVACINTDINLFIGKFKDVTITGFGQSELDDWLKIEAEKYGKEKSLQLISAYWTNTYHKPTDEFHPETDDLSGLVQDAELFYKVGFDLANSNKWPVWNENSEFKTVRETSMN